MMKFSKILVYDPLARTCRIWIRLQDKFCHAGSCGDLVEKALTCEDHHFASCARAIVCRVEFSVLGSGSVWKWPLRLSLLRLIPILRFSLTVVCTWLHQLRLFLKSSPPCDMIGTKFILVSVVTHTHTNKASEFVTWEPTLVSGWPTIDWSSAGEFAHPSPVRIWQNSGKSS